MKIVLGSDRFSFPLKDDLKVHLWEPGHEPLDLGCQDPDQPSDYPVVTMVIPEEISRRIYPPGSQLIGLALGRQILDQYQKKEGSH